METLIPITLAAGIAVGAVTVWLILNARNRRSFNDGKSAAVTEIATLNERLVAKERELEKLQAALDREHAELAAATRESSVLKADLAAERRAAHERSEAFKQAAEALSEKFKALSRDALKDNNQEFLNLAHATLQKFQATAKGELDQRQQAIDQLVRPLKESLEKVDGRIGEIE